MRTVFVTGSSLGMIASLGVGAPALAQTPAAAAPPAAQAMPVVKEMISTVVRAAFAEDKRMIEAQRRVRDLAPTVAPMAAIPQDRGPMLMRSIMDKLIKAETGQLAAG